MEYAMIHEAKKKKLEIEQTLTDSVLLMAFPLMSPKWFVSIILSNSLADIHFPFYMKKCFDRLKMTEKWEWSDSTHEAKKCLKKFNEMRKVTTKWWIFILHLSRAINIETSSVFNTFFHISYPFLFVSLLLFWNAILFFWLHLCAGKIIFCH